MVLTQLKKTKLRNDPQDPQVGVLGVPGYPAGVRVVTESLKHKERETDMNKRGNLPPSNGDGRALLAMPCYPSLPSFLPLLQESSASIISLAPVRVRASWRRAEQAHGDTQRPGGSRICYLRASSEPEAHPELAVVLRPRAVVMFQSLHRRCLTK